MCEKCYYFIGDFMKAALFDMDGLILDTERAFLRSAVIVGKELGLANIEEVAPLVIGVNRTVADRIFCEHYGENGENLHQKMLAHQYECMARDGIEKKCGIEEILSFLQRKGIKLAVVSSTFSDIVKREITEAGLIDYFDCIVGGESIVNGKPNPDIYIYACEKVGVSPCEAIGFEDSYNGVRALYAAGVKAFMIPDMLPPTDEMKEKAYAICDTLLEALEIIKTEY